MTEQEAADRLRCVLGRYTLATAVEGRGEAFGIRVRAFIEAHPVTTWLQRWRKNEGSFLDTLAWGHDRDFGPFAVIGAMRDRHVANLARAAAHAGVDLDAFAGETVLVVGCWTGCELVVVHGLGAKWVDGVEEVGAYASLANAQIGAWGLAGSVAARSLYDVDLPVGRYDTIYLPGVLYHLSDPFVALLLCWRALRPGGRLIVETLVEPLDRDDLVGYRGPGVCGWNWLRPSAGACRRMLADMGFVDIQGEGDQRARAVFSAVRGADVPAMRQGAAGFSRPDLLDQVWRLATAR
ncbi:MAG: DUF1698 domain-containing protein [Gemmatimonadota bacterium]